MELVLAFRLVIGATTLVLYFVNPANFSTFYAPGNMAPPDRRHSFQR